MSHVTVARTYLVISDNDSFPSLFLSNKSSWKKSKLHVETINHVRKEICTVMTNLISIYDAETWRVVKLRANGRSNSQQCYVRLHGAKSLRNNSGPTTRNNMQQGMQTYATSNFQQIITYSWFLFHFIVFFNLVLVGH